MVEKREIVSFRSGSRDGMPSPILLQNGIDLVFSIEDNGYSNFKPYIIRSTVANNWTSTVEATSPDKNYALIEPIADNIYAGAPFLRQLKTGQTILSYQGTEGQTNSIDFAEMRVVIGDNQARNFTKKLFLLLLLQTSRDCGIALRYYQIIPSLL